MMQSELILLERFLQYYCCAILVLKNSPRNKHEIEAYDRKPP